MSRLGAVLVQRTLGRWAWPVAGLHLGLLGLAIVVGDPQGTRDSNAELGAPGPLPLFPSAQEQLNFARKLKLSRRALPEEQRQELGLRAVHAYRAVRLRFPDDVRLAQEASFRAGQLLVAMGHAEAALDDFFYATQDGFRMADRARMEIGHVHRRRGHWERALGSYSLVANDPRSHAEVRASAQLLRGDMWLRMGRNCAAQEAWRAVINGSHDSRKRVLALDRQARLEIEFATPLRLAELLLECLQALDDVLLEQSEAGRRARRALDQSRLVQALASP